ncbi:MAG: CinA family protein [Candidatus Dormibacteria bacterium]
MSRDPAAAPSYPELEEVHRLAREAPLRTVATAESCTGGMLAGALSELPGSSSFFVGGVVAYANSAKVALLGVDPAELTRHGAVSQEVALALARGVRSLLGTTLGVSTTGVAGPDGSEHKPPGLIFVALSGPAGEGVRRLEGDRGRRQNRVEAVRAALQLLLEALRRPPNP